MARGAKHHRTICCRLADAAALDDLRRDTGFTKTVLVGRLIRFARQNLGQFMIAEIKAPRKRAKPSRQPAGSDSTDVRVAG